ncbi:MAG: AlwI family type II restriction endonuclease [Candidatus Aminicenantes bacterium]|nr:AlwI family type II restriction endonuclease [Candidatus Aminicenantes bacterium]NIM77899.1 AlwI family type II restriction endonuclease [Candidatus Aminicenantes bacterium]NIN17210.1 AlwI family type II restriction endonuclease [Candidatus Aminicenantes bacterium]NIN41103.1 AlwI family type II restriction endonuclease [Candidatus Aminicenantes bacterium]NIN83908.1 AlwI family type II restriction endonuclease [Candidatus Aminicenantes bacterium]
MTLWHIGNTTVRSPYRLKEALKVLKNSEFHGNLLGKEREQGFALLLNEKAVVRVDRIIQTPDSDSSDLGRKWRSALGQLGFVVKHLTIKHKVGIDPKLKSLVSDIKSLSGIPYEITPNGNNLIRADSVAEQQECFLRALAAYRIPSILETSYEFAPFSPLRFILEILLNLESIGEEPVIRFEEMALFVQRNTPEEGVDYVVSEILNYREKRQRVKNKKRYDNENLVESVGGDRTKAGTLRDYADLNFRYLKSTGLVQSKGRSISIVHEKQTLAELLVSEALEPYNDSTYVKTLWEGAKLPTDDKINAIDIIHHLLAKLKEHGEEFKIPDLQERSLHDLSLLRHQFENRFQCLKELEFAKEQAKSWEEITSFMKAFNKSKRTVVLSDGETLTIPGGEAPAYFEWIIWRAFLAVDFMANTPWDARRFKIDQDFLPLSHAPAGEPDMIFEFEEYVLVVEVTLKSSSRQEAAEGEPVRRHVAKIAEQFENSEKRVYCLFIAPYIDSNTAETFKIGN